jgi:hypothetical protein
MINIWDTECKKNGFDGIFVVDNIRDYKDVRENKFSPGCKAITFQEHQVAFSFYRNNNPIFIFKRILKGVLRKLYIANRIEAIETYDIVVKNSLKVMRKINPNVKTFFSVCLGWDNTPRYGENGYVLSKVTPEKFKKYLAKTEEYSTKYDQEFIFIACWNEWCEGMVLEPTKKDGYKYLDAIKEVYNLNKDLNL